MTEKIEEKESEEEEQDKILYCPKCKAPLTTIMNVENLINRIKIHKKEIMNIGSPRVACCRCGEKSVVQAAVVGGELIWDVTSINDPMWKKIGCVIQEMEPREQIIFPFLPLPFET